MGIRRGDYQLGVWRKRLNGEKGGLARVRSWRLDKVPWHFQHEALTEMLKGSGFMVSGKLIKRKVPKDKVTGDDMAVFFFKAVLEEDADYKTLAQEGTQKVFLATVVYNKPILRNSTEINKKSDWRIIYDENGCPIAKGPGLVGDAPMEPTEPSSLQHQIPVGAVGSPLGSGDGADEKGNAHVRENTSLERQRPTGGESRAKLLKKAWEPPEGLQRRVVQRGWHLRIQDHRLLCHGVLDQGHAKGRLQSQGHGEREGGDLHLREEERE